MRAHATRFLDELGMTESDMLGWANCQVARIDPSRQINGFSDVRLRSGVFLLQLALSVAPECVEAAKILPGETAEECEINARYAISCVLKMGACVFAVWEDIVEVRPKLLMTIFAAVMAEDLHRHISAESTEGSGENNLRNEP
uniref:Calponin-homology (CH) domain-containing protein n=1 Tax=Coccolithus braarudii TaxID=221442 RepID=A0A7S0LPT6_9EUKA